MRVLAFRHGPLEHLGSLAEALTLNGLECHCIDLNRSPAANIEASSADALIFMGGSMSANDGLPFIQRELDLIRDSLAARRPILGICLGAQLIAKALSAPVRPNPVKEIGWSEITLTEAAQQDPLFGGVARVHTVFQWHGETFDLPAGATLLASSPLCRHQAFRWGDRTYGLQFHLETEPGIISEWIAEDARCGDAHEVEAPIDPHAHAASMKDLARLVFGRWCRLIREQRLQCCASS